MKRRAWFSGLVGAFAGLILAAGIVSAQVGGPVQGSAAPAIPILAASDGTAAAPAYSFASQPGLGIYRNSANTIGFVTSAGSVLVSANNSVGSIAGRSNDGSTASWTIQDAGDVQFSAAASRQITLTAGGNLIEQKNGANAQTWRLYNTTTGPVYTGLTARTAGVLLTQSGGAMQMSVTQTTAPTVTNGGGTGPSCTGSDTAMVCTIGTAPPAQATFTVTFNGTWGTAPSCIAMRGTTGTTPVVTAAVASTTTVVVNLSANLVASEKYNIQCTGVA